MKRLLILATLFVSAPSLANAQALYTDLVVGAAFPNDVETIEYDLTLGGDRFIGALSGNYKTSVAAGFEVGMRGIGSKHLSLGISYDYFQPTLETISATGTINGTPVSETAIVEGFRDFGIDLNPKVHTVLGNLRYDFVGPKEAIQPYIGVGAGGAFVEESSGRLAVAGTAGIRAPLGYGFYTGVRYRYIRVFDFEDDLGIEYRDLEGHILSLVFGAQL